MTTPAQQYAAAKKRGEHPLTAQFIEQFDFGFDEFQIIACQAVEDGKGVLVAAPTGAGKTVVGHRLRLFPIRSLLSSKSVSARIG